jgi:hypothetical protein
MPSGNRKCAMQAHRLETDNSLLRCNPH